MILLVTATTVITEFDRLVTDKSNAALEKNLAGFPKIESATCVSKHTFLPLGRIGGGATVVKLNSKVKSIKCSKSSDSTASFPKIDLFNQTSCVVRLPGLQ